MLAALPLQFAAHKKKANSAILEKSAREREEREKKTLTSAGTREISRKHRGPNKRHAGWEPRENYLKGARERLFGGSNSHMLRIHSQPPVHYYIFKVARWESGTTSFLRPTPRGIFFSTNPVVVAPIVVCSSSLGELWFFGRRECAVFVDSRGFIIASSSFSGHLLRTTMMKRFLCIVE